MTSETSSVAIGQYGRQYIVDDSRSHRLDPIDMTSVGPYRGIRIQKLISTWRADTYYVSSVSEKIEHPAFREITEMGRQAIPYIVSELRSVPDFLFMALHLITGEDPTPPSAKGKPKEMINAWLLWADREDVSKDVLAVSQP